MFKVEIVEEGPLEFRPETGGVYRETLIAKSPEHVEGIRENARWCAGQGHTQAITVTRI
jgi:hypothetical protein